MLRGCCQCVTDSGWASLAADSCFCVVEVDCVLELTGGIRDGVVQLVSILGGVVSSAGAWARLHHYVGAACVDHDESYVCAVAWGPSGWVYKTHLVPALAPPQPLLEQRGEVGRRLLQAHQVVVVADLEAVAHGADGRVHVLREHGRVHPDHLQRRAYEHMQRNRRALTRASVHCASPAQHHPRRAFTRRRGERGDGTPAACPCARSRWSRRRRRSCTPPCATRALCRGAPAHIPALQVNRRTYVPQKLTGLISLYTKSGIDFECLSNVPYSP